jgi:hypothetical protein
VLAFRPAELDRHITDLDVTGLLQAAAKCSHEVRGIVERPRAEKSNQLYGICDQAWYLLNRKATPEKSPPQLPSQSEAHTGRRSSGNCAVLRLCYNWGRWRAPSSVRLNGLAKFLR